MNTDKSITSLNLKCTMVYLSFSNESGHWIYYNDKGELYNSYQLDHQSYGSSQFCQTYAMLYMLGDANPFIKKKFTDRLKSGINNYGNNIRIVVKFWRYIFKYDKLLTDWMISEVKSINDYDILNNNSYLMMNTLDINMKLIRNLLVFIYKYSNEISKLT